VPTDAGWDWQAAAGIAWTWAYRDDDSLTVGIEWFHNDQGFASSGAAIDSAFAAALASKPLPLVPLYTGRDYLGALAVLVSPGDWRDSTGTLIAMTNLSDGSGMVRAALQSRFLTDLGVETYAAGMFGDGEFTGYAGDVKRKLAALGVQAPQPYRALQGQVGVNFRVDL
jgi:hypothetical protein